MITKASIKIIITVEECDHGHGITNIRRDNYYIQEAMDDLHWLGLPRGTKVTTDIVDATGVKDGGK